MNDMFCGLLTIKIDEVQGNNWGQLRKIASDLYFRAVKYQYPIEIRFAREKYDNLQNEHYLSYLNAEVISLLWERLGLKQQGTERLFFEILSTPIDTSAQELLEKELALKARCDMKDTPIINLLKEIWDPIYIKDGIFAIFDHDLSWGDLSDFNIPFDEFLEIVYNWFENRESLRKDGTYRITKSP